MYKEVRGFAVTACGSEKGPHFVSKENVAHGVTANLALGISAIMQTFKSYQMHMYTVHTVTSDRTQVCGSEMLLPYSAQFA